jgi:hypothetical protein
MTSVRFNDCREIAAKFDSVGSCGHPIKKGDRIGYGRKGHDSHTSCPNCWADWCAENADADRYEAQYCTSDYR